MLHMFDVLEAVPPEIPDGHSLGESVFDQPPGGVGEQDLPTVSCRCDPGSPVDVQADVVAPSGDSLARVDTHAHADRLAVRPVALGQGALGCHRRFDRAERTAEGDEEGVPLGSDHMPVCLPDACSHDVIVTPLHRVVALAEPLKQASGPFDVGEQERDRSGRLARHARMVGAACSRRRVSQARFGGWSCMTSA
jgi:hypothetical protein